MYPGPVKNRSEMAANNLSAKHVQCHQQRPEPKGRKDAPPAGEPNVARAPNFNTTCWAPGPKSPEKITLLHQLVTSQ